MHLQACSPAGTTDRASSLVVQGEHLADARGALTGQRQCRHHITAPPRPGWSGDAHVCLLAQMSLLNCLCTAIPARERMVTCEEVFELWVSNVRPGST